MSDQSLRNLLLAYRVVLELASRSTLKLFFPEGTRGAAKHERGDPADPVILSGWDLPILRYLLHRHIKARVTALLRAYARRAATQEKTNQFSAELQALQHMDHAVRAGPSPWKLWVALGAAVIVTFGLGARRSATVLEQQDWLVLDRLRESFVRLGTLSVGDLLRLVEQGSVTLLLLILVWVMLSATVVLLFLRDPFTGKRILLTGRFGLGDASRNRDDDHHDAYALERAVFENLSERRPTEIQLDLAFGLCAVLTYLIFWTFVVVITPATELTGQQALVAQVGQYFLDWAVFVSPAIHHGVRTLHRWRARMNEKPLVLGGFWRTLIRSPMMLVPLGVGLVLVVVAQALGLL